MAEIIQMQRNTWRIEDNGVRFFVLEGNDFSLMIDSGMNTPEARELGESVTDKPLRILNTHADPDHISGNEAFDTFYMHPVEWEFYHKTHAGTLVPVSEGDEIDLGGRKLTIFDLPGHTTGSIAVLDQNARILYGGDSIQDGRIFMFGERRNFDLYIDSLEKLWQNHHAEFEQIYPSHGTLPVSPELIPKLIEAAKKIRNGEEKGNTVDFRGKKIRVADFGFAAFLCSPAESNDR